MIISMCKDYSFIKDTIAITNRAYVEGDYIARIKKVAAMRPYAIIFREKELTAIEYEKLVAQVLKICEQEKVDCYIHTYWDTAVKLGCKNIHIPINQLSDIEKYREKFDNISVSCHSLADVEAAIDKGATQIILGTIFETECKKGLKGKGLDFVKEVCLYTKENGNIPVFAIGGINPDNLPLVINAGARGGCMMSYLMKI